MTDEPRTTPRRALAIHPFLFAAYPVLFLYSQNVARFAPGVIVKPLAALIVAMAVLWTALGLILRNARKAAVIMSLSCLLFFSCRVIRDALPQFTWVLWGGLHVGPGKTTLIGTSLLLLAVAVPTLRTRHDLRKLTQVINVTAIVLVLIPVYQIVFLEPKPRHPDLNIDTGVPAWDHGPLPKDTTAFPDIYYIVCDAYTRDDILREHYGYDNRPFLEWLEAQGFYVARKSHSNYNFTCVSLPTTLNVMSHGDLVKEIGASCVDDTSMNEAMEHSTVTRFLKRRGYQIIAFSTGYAVTDVTNADVFLTPCAWRDDEFMNALLDMTPLGWVFEGLSYNHLHRTRILFTLDSLKSIPAFRSPKFVYAHIMAPHRPFVFGPGGEHVNPRHLYPPGGPLWPGAAERDDYRKFYADELVFLNRKLMEVITAIKQGSTRPPIIILQGDHGAASLMSDPRNPTPETLRERMSILNAYHLPGDARNKLYPSITPINSFRLILDQYFDAGLSLIEDRLIFDPTGDVTETLRRRDAGDHK